jgi:predicted metal-dependent hydrolase
MTAIPNISTTPDGITIEPRNRKFELQRALATDWFDNDPFLTAIFNAMSMSFPSGEKNFIDSIRHYEDQIKDPKLLNEIRGFYQQEGIHSREHRRYNKILCEQRGYDHDTMEGVYLVTQAKAEENPDVTPKVMLASTLALEHFTASMAEIMLSGSFMDNVEPTIKELWLWHCVEELEHKSVAFDVFNQISGSNKMRTTMMKISIMMLLRNVTKIAMKMLRHDKQLWKWKTLKSMRHFFFGKTGFIRLYLPAHKEYFRADFHPWDFDSKDLINEWQAEQNLQRSAA